MFLHYSFHSCLFRPSSIIIISVLWQLNTLCSYYSVIKSVTYVSVRFIRLEYLSNYVIIYIRALHRMLRLALLRITELQLQYLNQNVNRIIIIIIIIISTLSVLRQVHSLFKTAFFTKCFLVLPLPISSILSVP